MTTLAKCIPNWLKWIRNRARKELWWPTLVAKLCGLYNYYGISGNLRSLKNIRERTLWLAYRWINHRSQRRSYDWEQYRRWLKYHPLPEPRICHGYAVARRMHS